MWSDFKAMVDKWFQDLLDGLLLYFPIAIT